MLEDPRVIHWFSENAPITHPKLTPIPIGFANWNWNNTGNLDLVEPFLPHLKPFYDPDRNDDSRPNLIYINFRLSTNKEFRQNAVQLFREIGTMQIPKVSQNEFWEQLSGFKFVLSPPGNGLDCHRTYEAEMGTGWGVVVGMVPPL